MSSLGEVSWLSWRVWQRNRDVFFRLWQSNFIPALLEPVVILGVMGVGIGEVVREIEGESYLEFIGPGIMAAYIMFAPAFENSWGSYIRMAVRRTFDGMIVTPLSIEDVITGEILWGTTRAVVMGVIILVILAGFGVLSSPLAILILPMAVLQGFMFASLAMTFTAKAPSVNAFNYFFSLFVYPMFFFSGVFFPLEDLPRGLEIFAWGLPLTPAVHISQNLVDGHLTLSMLWSVLWIAGLGAMFYILALKFMRRRLIV